MWGSNWTITWLLFAASAALVIAFFMVNGRSRGSGRDGMSAELLNQYFGKRQRKQMLNLLLQKSYVLLTSLPFFQSYIFKIRKRLETLRSYDEYTIRRETMRIVLFTLGFAVVTLLLLVVFSRDLIFIGVGLLGITVLNGMSIDAFVNRLEDRLLKQSVIHFEDTRHYYQHTKNIEEAVYQASQAAPLEAAVHGERIYDILESEDKEGRLENYYSVAPNRYYKIFAGISYLISEYGDKFVRNGSMYLNAIASLIQEINYDILRREKLNYLLRGLTIIAVAPILATKPIELWARQYFPIMESFYNGKAGLIVKLLFFVVVFLSYIVLRKMLENDEARYVAKRRRWMWEKRLYEWPVVKWLIDRMKPSAYQKQHFTLTLLLKEANSPLTLEWLFVQRIAACLACFAMTVGLFAYMHVLTVNTVLYKPGQSAGMFGKMTPEDKQKAQEQADFDRAIISDLRGDVQVSQGTVIKKVSQSLKTDVNDRGVIVAAQRIFTKYNVLEREYFKWWELVVGLCVSLLAYQLPLWLVQLQKRMRQMDMQNEVDQFHTVIAILAEFERVSVENILEWMERLAVIFQDPIKRCLDDFNSGADAALEQLKEDAPFLPFVRIVEKLQLAVEKIPVRAAFDDLEMDREYYREKRKEHYMRVIEQKASWGRAIGFTPMTVIMFAYLVFPMLYLSVMQMGDSMSNIQHIQ